MQVLDENHVSACPGILAPVPLCPIERALLRALARGVPPAQAERALALPPEQARATWESLTARLGADSLRALRTRALVFGDLF